jgi:hypothetical protein
VVCLPETVSFSTDSQWLRLVDKGEETYRDNSQGDPSYQFEYPIRPIAANIRDCRVDLLPVLFLPPETDLCERYVIVLSYASENVSFEIHI